MSKKNNLNLFDFIDEKEEDIQKSIDQGNIVFVDKVFEEIDIPKIFLPINKKCKKLKDLKYYSTKELQEKIKTMEEDWKIINRKTAFYIEHEELEKVNASMIKFKSYIQLEEYTEAIPELENCKYILDHIREKEKMQKINLF